MTIVADRRAHGLPVWICVLLAASVVAVYWPVVQYDFITLDDGDYVFNNQRVLAGITWPGVAWAFTNSYAGNWHPLTWISHMLDCQIFGLAPGWHHATGVFIHILDTLLLFLVLRHMTGAMWRSAIVAALFGLHPLHVESVAWISERKDVLSALFFMLTLGAYTKYAEAQRRVDCLISSSERSSARKWYWVTLGLFVCGLMSKSMLVSLPLILLLLDYWPLARFGSATIQQPECLTPATAAAGSVSGRPNLNAFRLLAVEKLPFLALAAASCIITFLAQRQAGAVMDAGTLSIEFRVENGLLSYVRYIGNMFWPMGLAPYYPYAKPMLDERVLGAGFVLVASSALAWLCHRRLPFLLVGWLWYVITLLPVIGLVQVGGQSRADRYTYIPLIGLFLAFVWVAGKLLNRRRGSVLVGILISASVLLACLRLTGPQVRVWHDSATLFRHTIRVTTNNALAHLNLGFNLAADNGRLDEAAAEFAEALRIRPDYVEARNNLGLIFIMKHRLDPGIEQFRLALKTNPRLVRTRSLLASALAQQGKRAEAKTEYAAALKMDPDHLFALNDLAWMLATDPDPSIRDGPRAVQLAERALRLTESPGSQSLGVLAAAYAEAGRFEEAIEAGEKSVQVADVAQQTELAARNRRLLDLYRLGKAYHEMER